MFRLWRDILQAATPCKRLFHRNNETLPLWRNVHKKLESNQTTWRTGQQRGVCKEILQVQRNWITGNFKNFTYPVKRGDYFTLTISGDCVAWDVRPSVKPKTSEGCAFLDTESMEITEIPLYCTYDIVDGMLVRRYRNSAGRTVDIWSPKFHLTINEEHDGFSVSQIRSGSGLVVCESYSRDRGQRIELWKMGNPPNLLRTRTFENRDWTILKVDERFIVASEFHHKKAVTLYFISTETLREVKSLSAMNYECYLYEGSSKTPSASGRLMNFECVYSHGLLFQYRGNGLVRILDVASGTYLNDVHIPFRNKDKKFIKLLDTWVSANSKVIVIGWKYAKHLFKRLSHLSVYDLEAVKNPNSDPSSHLLYTLQFQFDIHSFVMNENEIAFSGEDRLIDWYVTVLKFANFSFAGRKSSDVKENPEDNEDSYEEIVLMKVKRMIYDRVDLDDAFFDHSKKEIVEMKMKKTLDDIIDFDKKEKEIEPKLD